MRIAFHRFFNSKVVHNLRNLCTSQIARGSAYDGSGKTTVNVLNNTEDSALMVDGIDQSGFLLNNGIKTMGPMILFPKSILFWNVASAMDINKDSFILFDILEPKIELLIIGLEDHYDYKFILKLKKLLKNFDIKNEICPVKQACSIFNFVSSEGRYAAAALIPPRKAESLAPFKSLIQNIRKKENNKKLINDK